MPRKALDQNPLGYMRMMVCYELGKTEEEVASWHIDTLCRWIAFFNLKYKAEKKAMEEARKKASRKNGGGGGGSYTM